MTGSVKCSSLSLLTKDKNLSLNGTISTDYVSCENSLRGPLISFIKVSPSFDANNSYRVKAKLAMENFLIDNDTLTTLY